MAAFIMIPIAVFTRHVSLMPGLYVCREAWAYEEMDYVYTVLLDLFLLVVPVLIMAVAYAKLSQTLWIGIREESKGMLSEQGTSVVIVTSVNTCQHAHVL
jgi:cholecystokinin A receptor